MRRAPLYEHALEGIGVVAGPELIEVGEHAIGHASASAGACLDDEIRVLGAYALEHLAQTEVVVYVYLRLAVLAEVGRTVVGDVGVGVPLDVVYLGIVGHQLVYDAEDEVLHLGVAEVEGGLCASAAQAYVVAGVLEEPVGVLLPQVTRLPVAHLGLYPYTELQTVLLGHVYESADAVGQLALVCVPVA